jgi:hypothetical protein
MKKKHREEHRHGKKPGNEILQQPQPEEGYSWETPPAPIPESDIAEAFEADAVIVGGGISGACRRSAPFRQGP